MADRGRKTLILGDKAPSRVTTVMGKGDGESLSSTFAVGGEIGGYKITSVIAENTGEAAVLLGERDNERWVIKLFHKNKRPKEEIINTIKEISSPFVVSLAKTGEAGGRFYTVMPFYENGDLSKNLPIKEEFIEKVVIPCVNEGMNKLHSLDIVHRDIKPSNLFLSNDGSRVIIGDFGISSLLDSGLSVRATGMSRTLGYAAPETSAGFVSKESDYYAFGVTLLQLATGKDVFAGMTEMQILYQTLNKKLPIPKTVSPKISLLIRGLTQKDRAQRWGYEEIHRWQRGEYVPIASGDDVQPVKQNGSGFLFDNQNYPDLKSLAAAMARNWEEAKKYLFCGNLENKLINVDTGMSREIATMKKQHNPDLALFRTLLILDEEVPIYFCGKTYSSPEGVGLLMTEKLPDKDDDIIYLVTSGCMKIYMEHKGYDKRIVDRLEYISSQLTLGRKEFYYALLYFLNPKYRYSDKFNSMPELIDYLEGLSDDERIKVSDKLIYDRKFHMWVFSKGYWKQLREWLIICEEAEWE